MGKNNSFREKLSKVLLEISKEKKEIVILTPDLAKSLHLAECKRELKERFITLGVCEANMVSVAAGLETMGFVPVIVAFSMFAVEKPFEQIRNSIAYPNLNVKIVATHSGLGVGKDGATHQAIEDIAIMRALPNMCVLSPCDGEQTTLAIRSAVKHKGPVYIRLGRDDYINISSEESAFSIGGSDVLIEGMDVTIAACGVMVGYSLRAAKILKAQGINVRVINIYSIKPLDEKTILRAAKETKAFVTVEDHSCIGGVGGAISELLAKNYPTLVEMIAVNDTFGESGSLKELYDKYKLLDRDIVNAAKRVLIRKGAHII